MRKAYGKPQSAESQINTQPMLSQAVNAKVKFLKENESVSPAI